jgi:hypothetical protein
MKKQILVAVAGAVLAFASSAQAQGTIFVNNYDSSVGVYEGNAVTPAPLTAYVQIWAGASAGSLAAIIPIGFANANIPITDMEGVTGSYFDGSWGLVNGVGGGGTAYFEVFAFDAGFAGNSSIWSQAIGTTVPAPPSTPTPATLLIPGSAIIMTPVPEPTTLALAGLGGLALLAFRRRS